MPNTSVVSVQTDFSAGEIDVTAKRDGESPIVKAACRQMLNWRILNTKKVTNRPGRRVLFLETGRVEEILMAPGVIYYLCFGNGLIRVRNSVGTIVFAEAGFAWTTATLKNIVWALLGKSIYITFGAQNPQILAWDGAVSWARTNFSETRIGGGQKRTIFYRLAPADVTMAPTATGGLININFSAAVLQPGHVGTTLRYAGRQMIITGFINAFSAVASVVEPLPPGMAVGFASAPNAVFNIGDLVVGATSSARGIVTQFAGLSLIAQLIDAQTSTTSTQFRNFIAGELVVGGSGSLLSTSVAIVAPQGIAIWDEEVMNSFRGWPSSVAVDQNRLIFSNFPSVPRGIGWSAVNAPLDFYVGANPTDAIFELVPDNGQVLFVAAGTESSQFVLCDNALWYIPISATNPLRPGSVAFVKINSDGCAQVQPRPVQEFLLYVAASLKSVNAVLPVGAYTRSYTTRALTDFHSHLFSNIIALATPTTDDGFTERYAYALNSDGTVICGKFSTAAEGRSTTTEGPIHIDGIIGWAPWSGGATVSWIAARAGNTLFTASYAPNGIAAVSVVEILDPTYYLDGAMLVNAAPAALTPPIGKGPLWWLPAGTVDLMDQATRMMGTYVIDADGNIIPQNNGGENLLAATLVAGQAWTATLEPFIPPVQGGQDVGQRMWKRRILRFQAYVQNSTGFVFQRLRSSGNTGPNLPAPGTVMKQRRISTWNQDDDPTLAPTLREASYLDRPIGYAHDPRQAVTKDTPGPLTVLELSCEVTV